MKKINLSKPLLILFLILSNYLYAQTPTTGPQDTSNQGLMYNNAKLSREAADKKNANEPKQEMRTLGKPSNAAATPTNLTDQEKVLSENFIHEGKTQQIVTEKCAGEMSAVCRGNEGKHKFMGMDPGMVKALSQAYAMIMTMGGDSLGGISKTDAAVKKEQDAANLAVKDSGKQAETVSKKADDYCKYIPTFTETIATVTQTAKAKELSVMSSGTGDNSQKDALLKAAASHDSRAKMAQMQATGWWGGAACYAYNATFGSWAADKNLIIKLGAASLLGAFYQNEVAANKEYAAKTREIANSLPGKGDCNPITDKLCYCSQPSTENDPTYCMPTLHKKALAANSYRVACTDNNMKIDPQCQCESSNTCFDSSLEQKSQGTLQLGLAQGISPFTGIRALARGELVGGTMNNQAYQKTAAIAQKALQELGSKISPSFPVSPEQKKLVEAMMSKGLPANVATLLAQNPPSASATNSAMAKFNGASSGSSIAYAPASRRGSNVVEFSGGDGLGTGGNSKKSGSDGDDFLSKIKGGGATKGAINSKIIQFAEKAQDMASRGNQIRKDDGAQLFDIISMRYQTSGRRLLEVETEANSN